MRFMLEYTAFQFEKSVLRRFDGLFGHRYSSSSLPLLSSGTAGICACTFLADSSRSSRRFVVSVFRKSL